MTHINKIKEAISNEKQLAQNELMSAINTGNFTIISELSKEIFHINQLDDVLGATKTKKHKEDTSEKNDVKTYHKTKKTNKTKVEKTQSNPILDSELISMPLTEDFTNKRPVSIELDNETHLVNSFRSLTETACRVAYNKNPSKFIELCENRNVNGDKHQYFSTNQKGMNDPVMIGNGTKAVYIDVAKLAINNLFFLKRALSELGYDLSNIIVTINPYYVRKQREKKN